MRRERRLFAVLFIRSFVYFFMRCREHSPPLHPKNARRNTHQLPHRMDTIFFLMHTTQAVGYIMPALLFIKSNRGDFRRAMAVWTKGSPDYDPALGERLWAMRKFFVPIFMVIFGVVATVAGVTTAVVSELSVTKA